MKFPSISSAILLLAFSQSTWAADVPLDNPSFESPVVATTGTAITGWSAGAGVELVREHFVSTVNDTADGAQFVRFTGAASGGSNTLSQTVPGHALSAGLYTLSFDVGDVFNDTLSPRPLTASLVRADTGETLGSLVLTTTDIPGSGNIGDSGGRKSLAYYLSSGSPAVGKGLIVRFSGGSTGGFAHTGIDKVTLDHDPAATPPALYTLDASNLEARTDTALAGMSGTAADGTVYSATRNGWYRNGVPWFPVSGEFHYVRYAPDEWDRELAKMRALGVDIVATYVFWNQHEAPEGTWNWQGQRDLRRFVELAAKHGLLVWLRPGPYINAEAANGGIPTFADSGKRSNNSTYLAKVDAYFTALASQLTGMWVKDGGPIVGMQIENEFASGSAPHITTLKNMAIAKGMVVPFYSVTANSNFESGTVIPLQGAYVYRGWEGSGGTAAMTGYIYGTDEWTANTDLGGTYYNTLDYPRGYCELGTGSPMAGNSRFFVEPKYVAGIAWDSVGRGSNYLGYYMFHGGTQLPGTWSGDWGTSYDFQAPLGEFGQLRETGRHYRRLHTFASEFAEDLIPARTSRDPQQILNPSQTSRLRYIGRFDAAGRGFVFVNNTQRNVTMVPQAQVRIEVNTAAGKILLPSEEITMPVDRTQVFPFRQDLDGAELVWATVEPLAKIENPGELKTYVYWLPDWTNRELAFVPGTTISTEFGNPTTSTDAGGRLLVHAAAGTRSAFTVNAAGSATPNARVLLITAEDSLNALVWRVDGRERLVIAANGYVCSLVPALRVEGPAGGTVDLEFFPGGGLLPAAGWISGTAPAGWARRTIALDAAPAAPVFTAAGAGSWTITGNTGDWTSLAHAHVRVAYAGGSAQLIAGGQEITRDLYHGDTWLVDLKRFPSQITTGLTLKVNAWDSGINGVTQPSGTMPALNATDWLPRREIAWNDEDSDGLRDAWETQFFGDLDSSATGDNDNDGLDNAREQELGTNPAKSDSDHDGSLDLTEVRIGTDPNNAASAFKVALAAAGADQWKLTWPARLGCLFRVERSSDLQSWETVADDVPGLTGSCEHTDSVSVGAPRVFYRVSLK